VLLDIPLRAAIFRESNWDLFALLVVSGLAATVYQARQKILPAGFLRSLLFLGMISALLSVILVRILVKLR
jgi:hypothetical protein